MSLVIVTFLLVTLIPSPDHARALPDPTDSIGVIIGPSDARTPSLSVDAGGALHLVHSDDASGERGIYYVRSADGTTWGPPARIDPPGTAAYLPSIAAEREDVADKGRLYVAYQVGIASNADVWLASSADGLAWTVPLRIDAGGANVGSIFPSVAASGGRVYVAWSEDQFGVYHVFFRASLDGGMTWGPVVQLTTAGSSNVRVRIDAKWDTVVVAWRQDRATGARIASARSEDAGATWTESVVFASPTVNHNVVSPEVLVDETTAAHVVWAQTEPNGEGHIRYAHSGDGVTWASPVTVDDMVAAASARAPSIASVAGTLWVVWDDGRSGDFDVRASWSADGVTWGDGLRNDNDLRVDDTDRNPNPGDDATDQVNAVVRTGGFGVYTAWEDFRGATWDIYYGEIVTSSLVITEIQDTPSTEASVELYNYGRAPVDLTGVTLDAGASSVDLTPLGFAPPRTHLVIGASVFADLSVPLDLGTEGSGARLVRGADLLARAATGTYGIAPDPLPFESSARFAGTLDYASSWTRATPHSFRVRNTVTAPNPGPPIMLNEMFYNADQPSERFVELYYRGTSILDLTGYRLVGDQVHTFAGGIVSASNPYAFLFATTAPSWFSTMDASGDNVYLYDASGALLDMVGWSGPHTQNLSLHRAVPGVGGTRAYDDPSALANGWVFDQLPSLAVLSLAADARVTADIGTTLQFLLRATNLQAASDLVNVEATAVLPNWPITFRWPNGTVLTDSSWDADLLPDLGVLGPGQNATFIVEVTVPVEAPLGDGNVVTAAVSAASKPVGRASVSLTIDLYPHFDITRTVDPATVYLEGSGPPYNEIADVTVRILGAGLPVEELVPQDVVFQIDVSGSMNTNDPSNLRVSAVKTYIDGMMSTDRGSIIGFNSGAWVVSSRVLTFTTPTGKALLKGDADTLACSPTCAGGTNIDSAIQLGNNWLVTYGNRSRPRVEILLTDGDCQPPCTNTNNLINQAVAEGIVIYTIGLGPAVNRAYLENIANRTGGKYFQASTPEDLIRIYLEIGTRMNRTAGVDRDVTDDIPMVEDAVAPYLTIVPGSFVDPVSGLPRPPAYMAVQGDRTVLQWNVSRVQIGETWSVRYSVTSTRAGTVNVALYPTAHAVYERWDGSRVLQPIPQATLEVLISPDPPLLSATLPADGAVGVPVNTPILATFSEAMDAPTVQWTIVPVLGVTPSWNSPAILTLDHGGFETCTAYTVEITAGKDLDGESLVAGPVPNPWTFTTECPQFVRYTITRLPERGNVLVDDVAYPAPAVFVWQPGEVHRIAAPDLDLVGPSRLAFASWDDGGARDHVITTGDEDRTITASYDLQHPAALTLLGLRSDRPARIASTLYGAASQVGAHDAWSSWVDDGSDVTVDDLIPGDPGERFLTADVTRWTVASPMNAVVAYVHQFTATVQLLGLEGNEVDIAFAAFGLLDRAASSGVWTAWVDAGSAVSADDGITLGPRERFRTLDPTRWSADEPLNVTVQYVHQFRPRVTLLGTDENHPVGASWHTDGADRRVDDLVAEWYHWSDAGTSLSFDVETAGTPPRRTTDRTTFTIDSPLDATIRYVGPPPVTPENWKPLLAVVYLTILVIAAVGFGSRPLDRYIPPKDGSREGRRKAFKTLTIEQKFERLSLEEVAEKVRRDRRFTRLLLGLPSAGAEAVIGLLSLLMGLFRIPEAGSWFPLGFWVNTLVLMTGIAAGLIVARKGYRMTEDDLLRLAEVRERASKGEDVDGDAS